MLIKLKGGQRQQIGRLKAASTCDTRHRFGTKKRGEVGKRQKEPKISLQYRSTAAVDFAQPSFAN